MNINRNKKNHRLDQIEERILGYLSQNESTEVNISELKAYFSDIDVKTILFYIEELKKRGYIRISRKGDLLWLDYTGKQYLGKDTSSYKCKAKTKKGEFCKNIRMKNSDYCYIHSFGRWKGIPFYKNSTLHFIISILLAIVLFSIGPSRKKQDQMLDNDKKTHDKLDTINGKLSEALDNKKDIVPKRLSELKDSQSKKIINSKPTSEIAILVSVLEKILSRDEVKIKSPDYINDKITGELRKIDISINKMVGSVPVLIIIECKDDSILDDTLWIEQIAQKRDAIKASKAVAVFNGYLGEAAMEKASHLNIETRLLSEITPDNVSEWFQSKYINQLIHHVNFLKVSFKTEKDKQEQLGSFMKSDYFKKNLNENIFLNTSDNKKYSFNHIWKGICLERIEEIYKDVNQSGNKVRKTIATSFSNPKSRYQIITENGHIDIIEIIITCDLWIEEKHLPFTLTQYSSNNDQLVDSIGFEMENEGRKYHFNLHKNLKTGQMYLSGDKDTKFKIEK